VTRRLRWFVAGVGVGVLASRRVARSASGTIVGDAAASVASRVRRIVDEMLDDARLEMRRRETRLREVLAAPDARATGSAGRAR
jgi:hypothetical protein